MDKVKELETKLSEAEAKIAAMVKREADHLTREEERRKRDAEHGIALGVELMDARIAADSDPRWLAFRTTMERAHGAGWFAAFFERQSKRALSSPACWLEAIEKALKIRAELASEPRASAMPELDEAIVAWLEKSATPGFKAATASGEF